MRKKKYWVATISKEHSQRAINGGFIQVCHGKEGPLKRMQKEDFILIYSSKITMEGNEKCQCFTALGKVVGDEVYSFQMTENFVPFRRNIQFIKADEVSILPLIENLEFIPNKKSWGYPFRYGFFEINENDFNFITSKMISKTNVTDNS
ncbi:EVE domain-containing protein [Flavobacterium sp. 90]|uniref:EVE domain-containing protein n=1 Tax=unclassified Flavobacterium TaxID=196869 RepID=UPI000EAF3C2D|nr:MULTISPECIES: EVE domain-containing protein [unclassified Flavobacterium]RKR11819.1 EVE domain-containing protein [Flavobacterium sp. 81]TCK55594.1 EVE domain-containing protein [Flavobacterium sp. 90]